MGTERAAVAGVAVTGLLLGAAAVARADDVPRPLPVHEAWTDVSLLDQTNDWSQVPGFVGRRGNQLVTDESIDPRTVLADGAATQISLNANRADADSTEVPGVAEFEVPDPVVGLHASSLADAPHLTLVLDVAGAAYLRIAYDVVDLDGSADDSVAPLALHGRSGTTGPYVDLTGAFVADATVPGEKGLRTRVDVIVPSGGAPTATLRWLTTNQAGQDEWIGIDDIAITASIPPTAIGFSQPSVLVAGADAMAIAEVTLGDNPPSTGLEVRCDGSALGDTPDGWLHDDGEHDDGEAGDLCFANSGTIPTDTAAGTYAIPCRVRDAQDRHSDFTITLEIAAVCGDGRIEAAESCDDGADEDGDGCSSACAIEAGWSCAGAPSECADVDECDDGSAGCSPEATCTNLPGGFTCACHDGWSGDGHVCATVCGDGLVRGEEQCDDAGAAAGDGCDEVCQGEAGHVCVGEPSVCIADHDADGIPDDLDNCPDVENGDQADVDEDDLGDACDATDDRPDDPDDPDDPDPPSGGGCASGGGAAAGPLLVALLLLLLQLRSSRTRRAASRRSW